MHSQPREFIRSNQSHRLRAEKAVRPGPMSGVNQQDRSVRRESTLSEREIMNYASRDNPLTETVGSDFQEHDGAREQTRHSYSPSVQEDLRDDLASNKNVSRACNPGAPEDSSEDLPLIPEEVQALQDALWHTRKHYRDLTSRVAPPSATHDNYTLQWATMQVRLNALWLATGSEGNAPMLAGLAPWTGGIMNWPHAQKINEPDESDRLRFREFHDLQVIHPYPYIESPYALEFHSDFTQFQASSLRPISDFRPPSPKR